MDLKYDGPLSNVAINCNLRPCSKGKPHRRQHGYQPVSKEVGRYGLTQVDPKLTLRAFNA